MGALFLFVFHGALPHQHHDQTSAQNCQVCQVGKTPLLQPIIEVDSEPPADCKAIVPSENSPQFLEPLFLSELTRAPPA